MPSAEPYFFAPTQPQQGISSQENVGVWGGFCGFFLGGVVFIFPRIQPVSLQKKKNTTNRQTPFPFPDQMPN